MKLFNNTLLHLLSFFLILIAITSCGGDKKGNGSNIPEPDKSTYEVEFTDNTVVVEEDVMESFISSDKESGVYKFNSDADNLLDLESGKIVFFNGHSVRRVKSVTKKEGEIMVNTEYVTEYVTLNEVIKNGTIEWENKIDWSSDQPEVQNASLILGDAIFASQTTSEFKIHYEGKIQEWD